MKQGIVQSTAAATKQSCPNQLLCEYFIFQELQLANDIDLHVQNLFLPFKPGEPMVHTLHIDDCAPNSQQVTPAVNMTEISCLLSMARVNCCQCKWHIGVNCR